MTLGDCVSLWDSLVTLGGNRRLGAARIVSGSDRGDCEGFLSLPHGSS